MTSPAVDYDIGLNGSYRFVERSPSGAIVSDFTSVVSNVSRAKRQRPVSQTSPRRSDGTRAPLAWWHNGSVRTVPISEYHRGILYPWEYRDIRITGNFGGVPGIYYPDIDPAAEDAALLKALLKLKGSKVNLGVALAEARQTAGLLEDTAKRITRMVNAFKKRRPIDWRRVKSGARKLPGSYLEMSYGWVPLLSDVYGSVEAMAESQVLGRTFELTAVGRSKVKRPFQLREPTGLYGVSHLTTGVASTLSQVTICCSLPENLLPNISAMGLTNPAEILWEKVPFSFVVDWALPIGNMLSVLDAGAFLQFKEGSISNIARESGTTKDVLEPGNQATLRSLRDGRLRSFRMERVLLYSIPRPRWPNLKNPLKLDKMAKALALMVQAFRH